MSHHDRHSRNHDTRSRSPPSLNPDPDDRERYRHRSHRDGKSRSAERSDRHRRHHHHHDRRERKRRSEASAPAPVVVLPFQARELSKRDLPTYEPMFAMYLDIQKGLLLEDLDEEEVKGRWKSFVRKWNRGELSEGWYDPSTLQKARRSADENAGPLNATWGRRGSSRTEPGGRSEDDVPPHTRTDGRESGDEDDDEDYGPDLPHSSDYRPAHPSGPTIPRLQDLELRRESAIEDAISAREESRKQHRSEIRSHKSEMRTIEDEIAPRAEPGTHERRLEKRREAAAANRAFAESRRGGSPADAVPDDDLMGSGENDLDALKKAQEREKRKKNEREIRREEILRARAAEREERLQKYRQKEDETIGWLKELAKQRFG